MYPGHQFYTTGDGGDLSLERESFNKLRVTSMLVSSVTLTVSFALLAKLSLFARPLSDCRPGRSLKFSGGDTSPSGLLGFPY